MARASLSRRGCHANGSVALAFRAGRGWFSRRAVALPGEVDDGGGVECLRGYGPRPRRGSAVCRGGRLDREGRGREEPAQVGEEGASEPEPGRLSPLERPS